jgi:ubiquitin-activating enzyme E1 C
MDGIDLTNLNRQFLFRMKDIGAHKASVAAAFIMARYPGVRVTPHVCYIQAKPPSFYAQFKVVIGGLDNLAARRWINSLLCGLVGVDEEGGVSDPDSVIPYIDGGTEGFAGQLRVTLPRITACFECSIDTFPPPTTFAMCTIAETPRRPEHCVAYAMMKLWPDAFPDRKLDKDSAADMRWLYERAVERAATFGIEGATYILTLGVVKSIIPAIASTNALIAASCVAETVKLASFGSQTMDNYYMYMASEGVYALTQPLDRNPACTACGGAARVYTVGKACTLDELVERLRGDNSLQLSAPTIGSTRGILYTPNPPAGQMAERVAGNLRKTLVELGIEGGDELAVTDPNVFPKDAASLALIVQYVG